MKVSLSWLQEYVGINQKVKDLADSLTMVGLEVEGISDRFDWLKAVRVGRITQVSSHPNADRLSICKVDIGENLLTIVCGAPNAAQDLVVPVALAGTTLYSGVQIKKTIIRGEHSEGMLCSQQELGLGPDGSGLLILPNNIPIGESLTKALNISDPVFEIGLTPNRPDCLSIIGIAREVAAIEKSVVNYPKTKLSKTGTEISKITSVLIEAPDHCPRYAARVIENITVGPSPFWIRDRLLSLGLRPINNIVDITNFVMMEMGQPLHAFDFDRLSENRIVVRTAKDGEHFTTLDQKERQLSSEMLMICDGQKPVAIAGIMGGLNSEIEKDTKRVLIESACFNSISIRKTAKRLGLSTDASYRFERGVDPDVTIKALDRAAELMVDIAGGTLVDGLIDAHPKPFKTLSLDLSVSATNRLLGTNYRKQFICELLSSIEMKIESPDNISSSDLIKVIPPSYRVDIIRPEDLMEEIARLSGYENIPVTLPEMPAQTLQLSERNQIRNTIRQRMTGLGFSEIINYSFIHQASCDRLNLTENDPRRATVTVLNPLSEDQAIMRSSLIPGLLETMRRNNNKQIKDLKVFEIGQTFYSKGTDELPKEIEMLAGLWTGSRYLPSWNQPPVLCDFYDLKGVVQEILTFFNMGTALFTCLPDKDCTFLLPGFAARIIFNGDDIGVIGQIHPDALTNFEIKQQGFIFELDIEKIALLMPKQKPFLALSKFPSTSRDATFIIDKDIESNQIIEMVKGSGEKLIENVVLFAVFEGEPIPPGKKSISIRITYRSSDETLSDDLINSVHFEISQNLVNKFNATLPT